MIIFRHFARATSTGQRSLTAGLLKMGLSNSDDWLKIKCNNSIVSGGFINNLNWGVVGLQKI